MFGCAANYRLASSKISCGTMETAVQIVLFNPKSRQIEGNMQFPLLDGQQITAFALDIDSKLRPDAKLPLTGFRDRADAAAKENVIKYEQHNGDRRSVKIHLAPTIRIEVWG